MTGNLDKRSGRSAFRRRLGFTMIEIMTSVTLSLMLMYAVARIFSRVGGTMNETTSIMQATNSLRNAKNRLTADLEGITVDPVPPRNSRLGDGYLCYVEGMGASIDRLYSAGYDALPQIFSTACVALDPERYQRYRNDSESDYTDWVDSTVGDVDDILSFTARAPVDKPFRGRYVRPKYNAYGRVYSGEVDTFESEFAEIVWFVRGTTLYRRVLPILSNERLQESLEAFYFAAQGGCDQAGNPDGSDPDNTIVSAVGPSGKITLAQAYDLCNFGCGFFRYYDVSVHLDSNGKLVANTLGDLTNRANRYGYWNPVGVGIVDAPNPIYSSFSIHGTKNAWYWLRMPTLQESAQSSFRAGAPFGCNGYARAVYAYANTPSCLGPEQILTYTQEDTNESPLAADNYTAANLPKSDASAPTPFIDFWNNPNIWDEVNHETGDLNDAIVGDDVFNQDVMLTNVLSFNVKAWDPDVNDYIDLGYNLSNPAANHADPHDLCSGGYYLNRLASANRPDFLTNVPIPCVYDTWSEQYQRDLYLYDQTNLAANSSYVPYANQDGSIADVSLDGKITSAQLKDYPPPYDVPLKSLQIEIRVFDPRSKQIRNMNFVVDLTK